MRAESSHYEHADNYKRFTLVGWTVREIACGLDSFWHLEIVYAVFTVQ